MWSLKIRPKPSFWPGAGLALVLIITSPSGAYYESGLAPVKIYVESNYVRAVRGGTGMAKHRWPCPVPRC